MEKKRKPLWLKILIWAGSSILSIVALVAVVCIFLFVKYDVNVFKVADQVKTLNEEIDLDRLLPNKYSDDDIASAKTISDDNLSGLITYTDFDGYSISLENISNDLLADIKFTDRQIGAIINNLVEEQEEININLGSEVNLKDYGFKVEQISFSNVSSSSSDFNVVVKIDLNKIKEENMKDFPFNWFRKGIPDSLYFSSTITINKGSNPFEYSTTGKSLIINNLTSEETESIFDTINTFLKLGTSKEFSKILCDTFVNLLIGDIENPGLAYSLKDIGATDFAFETDNINNYFVIKR